MDVQIVTILSSDLLLTDLEMPSKRNKPACSIYGKTTDLNDRMFPTYGDTCLII